MITLTSFTYSVHAKSSAVHVSFSTFRVPDPSHLKNILISLHRNTLKASPLQQLFRGGGIVHSNLERAELYRHASLEVLSRDGDIAISVAIARQMQGTGAEYMEMEAYAVAN